MNTPLVRSTEPRVYNFIECITFQGALSLVMLLSDNIWVLINYMSFVQWLSVGASVLGMVYLRYKKPEMPRPIKVNIKCADRS